MIIQLESATTEDAGRPGAACEDLARSWGHDITPAPAEATPAARTGHGDGKAIDPVVAGHPGGVAALRRAGRGSTWPTASANGAAPQELIDHARHQATQQVTVYLITQGRPVELRTLTPDQLLDQIADEDPAS